MIYVEETNDTLDAYVKRVCAPLYGTEVMLWDGHSASTTSATVTFVKYQGKHYAVTCHHVLGAFWTEHVLTGRRVTPAIHYARPAIHRMGQEEQSGFRWAFRSCRELPPKDLLRAAAASTEGRSDLEAFERKKNGDLPDIAICDLTGVWRTLEDLRSSVGIDLDSWVEPDWSTVQGCWLAYGYPDLHKKNAGQHVQAPMPRIVAELASSPPGLDRSSYYLQSELEVEHGWGFSGISGGPVLVAGKDGNDRYAFVGITYEGYPSRPQDNDSDLSFLTKKDIMLRGYHLTPERFENWLSLRRDGAVIDRAR